MSIKGGNEVIITILMATYNGENYVAEQIESIILQTETRWTLVVQDDCSNDATADVVKGYVLKYPGKILFIERDVPSGSAKNNFFSMLDFARTQYTMTCDQDDVWLPEKIKVTLQKIQELEGHYGKDIPLLVHTDLKVVDENLRVIADSMFQYQKLDYRRDKINNLLVQNIVTGCTMMVNEPLLKLLEKSSEQAIIHDWWFALVVSAFGKIGFVNQSTMLYRQHGRNEIGSKNSQSICYNLNLLINAGNSKVSLIKSYNQAQKFFTFFETQLPASVLDTIKAYKTIPNKRKIERLLTIQKYDFWKTGFVRKIGQIIFT